MSTSGATEEFQRRLAEGERDFQGASLSGANLRGANLRGADLRGANLRGASLHEADLREARLIRADLSMADVGMADFASADLNGADLRGANLKGAHFGGGTLDGANLRGADLHGADLRMAKLVRADLSRADLRVADISQADLRGADLRGADLTGANLKRASLLSATFYGADLSRADLTGANLRGANLTDTRLEGSNLKGATVGGTVFADLDLRQATGLETLTHVAPSTVGADTLRRSVGRIPEPFLQGCGLTPWEILAAKAYDPSLNSAEAADLQKEASRVRAQSPLQRKRVLISHSEADGPFVVELRRLLQDRSVFSWVAAHEMKGAVRERNSKLVIEHNLVLLLVLSESSVQSDWVEHEVRLARKLEKRMGEEILCPVSLDDSWKAASWQSRNIEHINDERVRSFAEWRDKPSMEKQFASLFDGMALFHPAAPG